MSQLQWTGRRLKKTDGGRKQKACRAPGLVGALPDRGGCQSLAVAPRN